MWLSERSALADSTLVGGQLGLTGQVGPAKLTGAVGYFDVGAVEGQATVTNTTLGCTGNSVLAIGRSMGGGGW